MKNMGAIFVRLILITTVIGGGVIGYQKFLNNSDGKVQLNEQLSGITGQVEEIAQSMNIDTKGIMDTANKKLVESQPIIEDQDTVQTSVLGETSTNLSDTAKQFAQDTANKIADQVKDLPRHEAAKITRQVCDQIIADLSKE